MFRFEGFCEDKHLADVLRALQGKAYNVIAVPTVNATVKNGKNGEHTVEAEGTGDRIEQLREVLKKTGVKVVDAIFLKEFAATHGLAPNSYSYVLKNAVEAKLLKKVAGTSGRGTKYGVHLS